MCDYMCENMIGRKKIIKQLLTVVICENDRLVTLAETNAFTCASTLQVLLSAHLLVAMSFCSNCTLTLLHLVKNNI